MFFKSALFHFVIFSVLTVNVNASNKNEQNIKLQESSKPRALVIDGGGIRGICPATILEDMEDDLKDFADGERIQGIFKHGITGTSTGSFIALGLALNKHRKMDGDPENIDEINGMPGWVEGPYSAKQISAIYNDIANGIFTIWSSANCSLCCGCDDGCSLATIFSNCGFFFFNNCGGFCGPQYNNTMLRKKLEYYFGDCTLEDTNVPVQVVTFDIGTNSPLYLSSLDRRYKGIKMVDAALMSSAAPTYFPAVEVSMESVRHNHSSALHCIDGGLHDNSASLAAMTLALEFMRLRDDELKNPNATLKDLDINNLILVSLGTGEATEPSRFERLKMAGKLAWAKEAPKIAMGGSTDSKNELVSLLLNTSSEISQRYYRFQTTIPSDLTKMDAPQNMPPHLLK